MRKYLRKHQIPLLLIGTCVLLFSYLQLLHASEAPLSFHETTLTDQDYERLTNQLTLITERHNPREAFSLLRRQMKENTAVTASCHGLAHGMGHAAYMKYQDFGKAMEGSEQLCNSGYIHGVIEAYFSDIDDFKAKMTSLCEPYMPGTYVRLQCDHGVGHGVMFATQNDLPESLKLCSELDREDARSRCVNGVYMENIMVDQKTHVSAYIKQDDFRYPCQIQTESNKPQCYGYVATNFLKSNPGKYKEALAYCNRVESAYIHSCMQGVGRGVIVLQIDRPDEVVKLCMSSEEYSDTCLEGLVAEYINHYASTVEASKLCRKFPHDKQSLCVDAVRQKSVLFTN